MYNFGPANFAEAIVFGAQRPGYPSKTVETATVTSWIDYMQSNGIERVCCLLGGSQLAFYEDLLGSYRLFFGSANVCSAPIEDYYLSTQDNLTGVIMPFLQESDRMASKAVVHCSGGSGRTGHVLATWLHRGRGFSVDDAIEEAGKTRNPKEAISCGKATLHELKMLIQGS